MMEHAQPIGTSDQHGGVLNVKVRLQSKDIDVALRSNSTVGELMNRVVEQTDSSRFSVKLIFNGKILQPAQSLLADFNIKSGSCVLGFLVNQAQFQAPQQTVAQPTVGDSHR